MTWRGKKQFGWLSQTPHEILDVHESPNGTGSAGLLSRQLGHNLWFNQSGRNFLPGAPLSLSLSLSLLPALAALASAVTDNYEPCWGPG